MRQKDYAPCNIRNLKGFKDHIPILETAHRVRKRSFGMNFQAHSTMILTASNALNY